MLDVIKQFKKLAMMPRVADHRHFYNFTVNLTAMDGIIRS